MMWDGASSSRHGNAGTGTSHARTPGRARQTGSGSQQLQRTESTATASSSRSQQSLPQPSFQPHGGGGMANFMADVDSSAPIISDQIFGDGPTVADAPHHHHQRRRRADSSQSVRHHDGPVEEADDDIDEEHAKLHDNLHWARHLPWYRRPDERWLYPFVLLLAIGSGMVMAPKIELSTQLVCEEILGVEAMGMRETTNVSMGTIWSFLPPPRERPPLSSQCRQSAEVEAASLALSLKISMAMGILSAITTGFWGGLSDRHGRTVTLRVAMLGLTIADVVYICVGLFPQSSLPLGKNILILSAAIEGLLGGLATLIASHQAYIAGVTAVGTRASQLSRLTGAFFLGIGTGPALGGLIAKHTRSTMAPFYFALAAHSLYLLTVTLVLPESSSPESMKKAKEEHRAKMQEMNDQVANEKSLTAIVRRTLLLLTVPLQPLSLLLPRRRDSPTKRSSHGDTHGAREAQESHISVSHVGRRSWDFNLTLVALAYFMETLGFGIMTPKIQYSMKTYDWNKEQLGYYLTFSSFTRVICLTAIIPLFIKWWHRPPVSCALPQDGQSSSVDGEDIDASETTPLLDEEGRLAGVADAMHGYGSGTFSDDATSDYSFRLDPSSKQVERLWMLRARHLRQIHDSHFDRKLVLLSLCIAAGSYLALALFAKTGPIPFITFSGVVCLAGAAPAGLSSLALSMLERPTDAGKFFAAWSVLSALSQTILGPLIFSALFIRTVSTLPESIFVLGLALFVVATILVAFVRVRHPITLPALPPRPPAQFSRKKTSKGPATNGDETLSS